MFDELKEFLDKELLEDGVQINRPLEVLDEFLQNEDRLEASAQLENSRYIGRPLSFGYKTGRIITCDAFKKIVGGISQNSFLIMVPDDEDYARDYFNLLRVKDAAATPLETDINQTHFELQKQSMHDIDPFTQNVPSRFNYI